MCYRVLTVNIEVIVLRAGPSTENNQQNANGWSSYKSLKEVIDVDGMGRQWKTIEKIHIIVSTAGSLVKHG